MSQEGRVVGWGEGQRQPLPSGAREACRILGFHHYSALTNLSILLDPTPQSRLYNARRVCSKGGRGGGRGWSLWAVKWVCYREPARWWWWWRRRCGEEEEEEDGEDCCGPRLVSPASSLATCLLPNSRPPILLNSPSLPHSLSLSLTLSLPACPRRVVLGHETFPLYLLVCVPSIIDCFSLFGPHSSLSSLMPWSKV